MWLEGNHDLEETMKVSHGKNFNLPILSDVYEGNLFDPSDEILWGTC